MAAGTVSVFSRAKATKAKPVSRLSTKQVEFLLRPADVGSWPATMLPSKLWVVAGGRTGADVGLAEGDAGADGVGAVDDAGVADAACGRRGAGEGARRGAAEAAVAVDAAITAVEGITPALLIDDGGDLAGGRARHAEALGGGRADPQGVTDVAVDADVEEHPLASDQRDARLAGAGQQLEQHGHPRRRRHHQRRAGSDFGAEPVGVVTGADDADAAGVGVDEQLSSLDVVDAGRHHRRGAGDAAEVVERADGDDLDLVAHVDAGLCRADGVCGGEADAVCADGLVIAQGCRPTGLTLAHHRELQDLEGVGAARAGDEALDGDDDVAIGVDDDLVVAEGGGAGELGAAADVGDGGVAGGQHRDLEVGDRGQGASADEQLGWR